MAGAVKRFRPLTPENPTSLPFTIIAMHKRWKLSSASTQKSLADDRSSARNTWRAVRGRLSRVACPSSRNSVWAVTTGGSSWARRKPILIGPPFQNSSNYRPKVPFSSPAIQFQSRSYGFTISSGATGPRSIQPNLPSFVQSRNSGSPSRIRADALMPERTKQPAADHLENNP